MAWIDDLRATIESRLSIYDAADGVGLDAYCAVPTYHPMADGKCLQVLATLHACRLLSMAQLKVHSTRVIGRLESSALPCFNGWSWGLGFSWRGLPVTEPFLITSAIITRGGLDCHNAGLESEPLGNLMLKGLQGLSDWTRELTVWVDEAGRTICAYSPHIREPVYNPAAYACGTLKLSEDARIFSSQQNQWQTTLRWIQAQRIAHLGWPYSPTSNVIDLLHQCYILNALADSFGTRSIEAATAEMVGQFAGPCCFADVMRLANNRKSEVDGRDIPWLRPLGLDAVELLPRPARLWSLGELLVLLSRLGRHGVRSEAWVRLGRRTAESILQRLSTPDDTEARYPRHVMHALHGLACYLALLRESAQTKNLAAKARP